MIISIVGKSASGKSTISRKLEEIDNRFVHIDIDMISHYVLTLPEVKKELLLSFGNSVISNGEVDRKALGNVVFQSKEMMDELTRITWPHMEAIIDEQLSINKSKIVILDWLLLPRTKFFKQSDLRVWVDAPYEERVERAVKRSPITRDYFKKRDNSGIEYDEDSYDIFIDNRSLDNAYEKVEKIYEKCIISG